MWCTRWYLPLLLLPIPTAPPYFLLLFLFSLTLHAKPCFYCIVLLSTLFVSSCYWQPFPLDSPLSIPWADNVTTFAQALNSSISFNYSLPLPSVMKAADRCWCDLSNGDVFQPFNVSQWEHIGVERVRDELERQHKLSLVSEDRTQATQLNKSDDNTITSQPTSDLSDSVQATSTVTPHTPSSSDAQQPTETRLKCKPWSMLKGFNWHSLHPISVIPTTTSFLASAPATTSTLSSTTFDDRVVQGISSTATATATVSASIGPLPLIRKEYDLRPYGISLTIDFGWTR